MSKTLAASPDAQQTVQAHPHGHGHVHLPRTASRSVLWLVIVTVVWTSVECGVSGYAAFTAGSAALFAFSSDAVVELLSAVVVLLQWSGGVTISERIAGRISGTLLYALAAVVGGVALASFALKMPPDTSRSGIAITLASLLTMPVLAGLKRREACRLRNVALAADAMQSATCAYLAGVTLLGLVLHATLHIAWFDDLAALIAVPLLIHQGRQAWRGQGCGCF